MSCRTKIHVLLAEHDQEILLLELSRTQNQHITFLSLSWKVDSKLYRSLFLLHYKTLFQYCIKTISKNNKDLIWFICKWLVTLAS